MPAPILIVGQGLAGSLLAGEFSRARLDFEVADIGHASAASRVGAGIINPITGQRLVKSWRVDELLPDALKTYRDLERALGLALVRRMRVRRFFREECERSAFSEKAARGELAPYAGLESLDADGAGFWINGAAQIDTAALIAAMRTWLRERGLLRESQVSLAEVQNRPAGALTIFCTGVGASAELATAFPCANLRPARGELLTLAGFEAHAFADDVILNDGHWFLPLGGGRACVGATFEPGATDRAPTIVARDELLCSAARLLRAAPGRFHVVAHEVGVRVTTPDKHPVVGRSPRDPQIGIFNGLGSKGALLAPWLAQQWARHLTAGAPFDPAVAVGRFEQGAE
jgi:glycine/D-amino acid oxidase-like deaminating enzyme